MMRATLLLPVLLVCLLAPGAAGAATLSGGLELRFNRLAVKAADPATKQAKRVTVPAFSGAVGTTSATLRHSGVLQIARRNLTGLVTTLGPRPATRALVAGKRRVLFTYAGTADVDATAGTASLTGARAALAPGAAKLLGVRAGPFGTADAEVSETRASATGLTWRPRESFIRYINSETGRTEVSGGAENGPQEVRPGTDAALVYSFVFPAGKGTLAFLWQARGIDLAFSDPVVAADGSSMSVTYKGQPLRLLALGAPTDGTYAATLTEEGAAVFNGFYAAGDEFGTVTAAAATTTPGSSRSRRYSDDSATSAARKVAGPRRIVALSPFTANTLVDFGRLPVAIANTLGGQDSFSPKLANAQRLELSHPNGPNLEQLAALEPDMVMSSPTWNRGHDAMRELGIKVALADPTSVADVDDRTRQIGRILGKSKRANRIAAQQVRDIAAAKRGITERPRTLVILGVGRAPYAFLPDSWGGSLITQAGAQLLTEDLDGQGGFARISDEEVVIRNPEVIIAVPHGNARDIPSIGEYLRNNPSWQNTDAGRKQQIYVAYGNALLQPFTDVGRRISDMRELFLKN